MANTTNPDPRTNGAETRAADERRRAVHEPFENFCFVLCPKRDQFASAALLAYADRCEADCPALAADLREWVIRIESEADRGS